MQSEILSQTNKHLTLKQNWFFFFIETHLFASVAMINTMTKEFITSYRTQSLNEGSQAGAQGRTEAGTMET